MTQIRNSLELGKALSEIAESVIQSVSNDVMKILQERIQKDVYEYGGRNHYYYNKKGIPTYQFRRAFKWDKISNSVKNVTRTLFYDWQSMRYDPKTFLHGNPNDGDLRSKLAELLNIDGYDEMSAFGGKLRRPYWDNFIDELFSSIGQGGELDVLFSKYLEKYQSIKF